MANEALSVAIPAAGSITSGRAGEFEERWAAWQAKGAAHERATGRMMVIAVPIVIIAAVAAYVLLGL
jgi:hypothetical protein